MLAPRVTRFSLPGAVKRYADVARAADMAPLSASDEDAADALPRALAALNRELGVPPLSSWRAIASPDAFESVVPKMAADALASGSPNNNPVVPTAPQIEALYRDIFHQTRVEG